MTEVDIRILDVPSVPTGATLEPDQIALHEAAHAVLAHNLAGGIDDLGIDLRHRSADGASGGVTCMLLDESSQFDIRKRMDRLWRNVMVICAGPACDAKLTGQTLEEALRNQWSDHRIVVQRLPASPAIDTGAKDGGKGEMALVLSAGLRQAAKQLERPEVWASIQAVSNALVSSDGLLSGPEIERIIEQANASAPTSQPPHNAGGGATDAGAS